MNDQSFETNHPDSQGNASSADSTQSVSNTDHTSHPKSSTPASSFSNTPTSFGNTQPPYQPQYQQPQYQQPQYQQPQQPLQPSYQPQYQQQANQPNQPYQPYQQPMYGQPMYQQPAEQPAHNLSVASLVLAIIGYVCCGLTAIAGLICGISAKKQGNTEGLTTVGIVLNIVVLGIIALTILGVVAMIALSVFVESTTLFLICPRL